MTNRKDYLAARKDEQLLNKTKQWNKNNLLNNSFLI
jgi:hypothetical protein